MSFLRELISGKYKDRRHFCAVSEPLISFCAIVISEVFAKTFEPRSTSVMQFIIEILFTMTPRFQYAFGFVSHL